MGTGAYQFLLGSDVLSAEGGLMKATTVRPGVAVAWHDVVRNVVCTSPVTNPTEDVGADSGVATVLAGAAATAEVLPPPPAAREVHPCKGVNFAPGTKGGEADSGSSGGVATEDTGSTPSGPLKGGEKWRNFRTAQEDAPMGLLAIQSKYMTAEQLQAVQKAVEERETMYRAPLDGNAINALERQL